MNERSYRKGDWLSVCDCCGQTFYASEMKMRWDERFVCKEDWEPRHPLDYVRAKPDDMSVPIVRAPGAIVYKDPEDEITFP